MSDSQITVTRAVPSPLQLLISGGTRGDDGDSAHTRASAHFPLRRTTPWAAGRLEVRVRSGASADWVPGPCVRRNRWISDSVVLGSGAEGWWEVSEVL